MIIFGTKSRVVLLMIFIYESTRLRIVSTCLSNNGSIDPISSFYKKNQNKSKLNYEYDDVL